MLKLPLELGKIEASGLIDYLYEIFERDFVHQRAMLSGKVWIDPRSERKNDGKEDSFWHLITRGKVGDRYPDYRRAERLEWVRQIIDSPTHPCVQIFYHRESNQRQDVRMYLWAEKHDFVVIIQRLGKSRAFLVTSFYVDHKGKRDDYRKRLQHYQSGRDADLSSNVWF